MKLTIKYSSIQTNILPNLVATRDSLSDTINTFGSMDIPNFAYTQYLNECKSGFISSKKSLEEIEEWLRKSNQILDNQMNEMSMRAKELLKPVVAVRESVIKDL